MKSRIPIILLATALMGMAIIIFLRGVDVGHRSVRPVADSKEVALYKENKLFERSAMGMEYIEMPTHAPNGTNTEVYNQRRAFPGAPPTIPHPIDDEKLIGGNTCLKCHQNGGYVNEFKKYAPVTPHPEMQNCRQCHVPVNTDKVFRESNFHKTAEPKMGQAALTGSPPMIPHALQMKENCLACHAGPGARKEIRVSHPERVNCRQCHVPNEAALEGIEQEFVRKPKNAKK